MSLVTAMRRRILGQADGADAGFTLMEMLVAITLFSVVMVAVMTTVLTVNKSSGDTTQTVDANEESRLAISRISRDLREADKIVDVAPNDGSQSITVEDTFWDSATNSYDAPTQTTYSYDATNKRILLTGEDQTGSVNTLPILAGNVSYFNIQYYSSIYQCDTNANGTDWTELDKAPVSGLNGCSASYGNNNGVLDQELSYVDRVVITITVLEGSHSQTYRTAVDLRNLKQS